MRWSVGVTTVEERAHTTLPRTLNSLAIAGWAEVSVFTDVHPRLGVFGRWALAAWELLVRMPCTDMYMLVQDDVLLCKSLRKYLEACPYPDRGYWNLYTATKSNEPLVKDKPLGLWLEGARMSDRRFQFGKGALALAFSREAMVTLLSSRSFVEKPLAAANPDRPLDGAVVTAMNLAGWTEHIHHPSLVQHQEGESTIGNRPDRSARTYMGEAYDAMEFLRWR